MPTIEANGIRIAYHVHGQGDPLLLVTGIGYCSWFWRHVVPGLAAHFQVITFDNRGAGDSDKPPGPYTVAMLAADTAGLLDALGIQGANVFGHSLGGYIAQELAITRPDLVGKLILASTNHGGTKIIPITAEAMEVLTNRQGDPLELIQRGIRVACAPGFAESQPHTREALIAYRLRNRVPPEQFQAQVRAGLGMAALSEEQVERRMQAIRVPVLILFGEHDQVVPAGNAELMAARLPDARIWILEGAGHLFPIEAPQATVEAVRDFLLL